MSRPDLVVVETMPEYLRASHIAAGNSGVWPHNGAVHVVMTREDADAAVDSDPEWTWIVCDTASDEDLAAYGLSVPE